MSCILLCMQSKITELITVSYFVHQSKIHCQAGLGEQAIGDLDTVVALGFGSPKIWMRRGDLYRERRDTIKALYDYDQAIQMDTNCVAAYIAKGSLLTQVGRFQEAAEFYDQAIKKFPSNAQMVALRRHSREVKGDSRMAIADCNAAITLYPQRLEARLLRANLYEEKKLLIPCGSNYVAILRQDPLVAMVFFSQCHTNLISVQALRAKVEKEMLVPPTLIEGHLLASLACLQTGDFASAKTHLSEILRLDPSLQEIYFLLAAAYAGEANFEHALLNFQKMISARPDYLPSLMARGNVYLRISETALAIEDFSAAIRRDPNIADLYLVRGLGFLYETKEDLALANFNKAIKCGCDKKIECRNQ